MAYTIAFTKQATKTYQKLPADIKASIRLRLGEVAENPFAFHPNVTRLQNREGFRLRIGDWRIIYDVQTDKVMVLVLKIGLRGEVYR